MHGHARLSLFSLIATLVAAIGIGGCNSQPTPADTRVVQSYTPPPPPDYQSAPPPTISLPSAPSASTAPAARPLSTYNQLPASAPASYPKTSSAIMLGIDVLESQNFSTILGKRIGLLSHPAGVNRNGVSTIDVLRRASNVKLVALFGPEHGIYGDRPASENIADTIDKKTGLPAYSLHGKNRRPTKEQLKGMDALVIDMQDIGVRSYTFSVCMKYAIEACFENGVEVIVLDRPNPLGGIKVDGPLLDKNLFSGVGQYQIPYVHGLTMGELARMAVGTPGWLAISETARAKGRLTVVQMRGWRRNMRWPETGLHFVATSPNIPDFSACVGYAMTGLGCQLGGFKHGIGTQYPFRGLSYNGRPVDDLLRTLNAMKLSGLGFRKVALTAPNGAAMGIGVYVDVIDWDDWRPTELSFHLMQLACLYAPANAKNPFALAAPDKQDLFNKHTGSYAFWTALKRDGARVDIRSFLSTWQRDAQNFQQASKRFWLYN